MNRYLKIALLLAAISLSAGCTEQSDDAATWNETLAENTVVEDHAGHTHAADSPATMAEATVPGKTGQPGGKVLESFDSGGYTYVRLQTQDGEIWAAGPMCEITTGDDVTLSGAMVMRNFKASSLDRTFAEIWFASAILAGGDQADAELGRELEQAHGNLASGGGDLSFSGLEPPAGGVTIAGLYAAKADFAGRRVKLRGKVVKYLDGIMGRNWIHLQDGTGDAATGDHDLTVTTDGSARRGDTVLIEGVVTLDKDFGSGYFYAVIVEDATVTVSESM